MDAITYPRFMLVKWDPGVAILHPLLPCIRYSAFLISHGQFCILNSHHKRPVIRPWECFVRSESSQCSIVIFVLSHDDVIKWKHFQRYWSFVRGIHRSPVNSPHKGQWRGVLMFSLICVWIIGWVNNREAGDLRRHCAHYDVIVMWGHSLASVLPLSLSY